MSEEGAPGGLVWRTTASDTDDFLLAVPGASGSLVRTGRGRAQTTVTATAVGPVQLLWVDFQFPMVGTAHPDGDVLVLIHVSGAPPGGSWDGTTLRAGQTFVYPPGTSQTAVDPDGLRFAMAVVPWAEFEAAADTLGFDPETAARRRARSPNPVPLLRGSPEPPGPRGDPPSVDSLLDGIVRAACEPVTVDHAVRRRGWSPEEIVRDVDAYLASTGEWRLPMLTVCRGVGVSERKLETSFREAYGITPQAFMRHRALQAAHTSLAAADPASARVSTVAKAHGFQHLGRFASYHRAVFGETPAETLRRRGHR